MRHLGWVAVTVTALLAAACAERSNLEIMESARAYLAKQDVPAATVELRTLLQRKPDAPEARYLLGKIAYEAGDLLGAEDQLGLALKYGYPEDEVVPLLARVLAHLNRTKAIVAQFGELEFRDPQATADLKMQVAAAHIVDGEIDQAEQAVARALAQVPDHPQALAMQARLKAIRGDVVAAAQAVDDLLRRMPDNADALAFKGDLLMMARPPQVDAALDMHRRALALSDKLSQSHAAVISMLIARGDVAGASTQWVALKAALPTHPQTVFFEGVLALLKGDATRALLIAQRMLVSSPTDLRLLLLGGQAAMQTGQLEQAEALLSKATGFATQAVAPRHLLAELYVRTGRVQDALKMLEPLLARGGSDAVALTLAGRAHLIAGDAAAAKASLARAMALRPNDAQVRTAAALARLGAGQADAAFAELEAIAKGDEGTTADLALISARLDRRQFDAANQAVDVLAAKLPGQVLPDHLRGRIAVARGDRDGARAHFEAALAKDGDYMPSLSALVDIEFIEGRADLARALLEAARKRNPSSMQVRLALASLAARSGEPPAKVATMLDEAVRLRPDDPTPHLALIDHHMVTGSTDLAWQAAEKAVPLVPDSQAVLDRLGLTLLARGGVEQSIATYNRMTTQWPRSPLGYQRLAEIYLRTGNTTMAAERVQQALAESPTSVDAQRVAAVVALRQKKTEQAQAIARAVQKQLPDAAVGYELEAEVAMALRRFDQAVKGYRTALDHAGAPEVAKKLHVALLAAKRPDEARRWADAWLAAHPDDTPFVVHLADTAVATGDLASAEKHYRDVMARLPGNALAMNNVAYMLVKQKKPGGLALAEEAARLAPNEAPVLDTLAAAYAAENQLVKAIEWQRKTVDLAPQTGLYRLALARLYIQAGDREKALVELDRLATLGRSFSGYNEVAQLRKKLGP